ncbi:hypothetical protein E4U21_005586 [Claviceps maximensis]|nr:hypothetical protein E4U21_005586 [Claviceps maximensis]
MKFSAVAGLLAVVAPALAKDYNLLCKSDLWTADMGAKGTFFIDVFHKVCTRQGCTKMTVPVSSGGDVTGECFGCPDDLNDTYYTGSCLLTPA